MGEISDKYKQNKGDTAGARIIAAAEEMSKAIPYVKAAVKVAWHLFSTPEDPENAFIKLEKAVDKGFENVTKDQKATDLHATLVNISDQVGIAKGALDTANDINEGKNEPSNDIKFNLNYRSHTPIETLGGFGYWNRPFFGDADAYNDCWNGTLYPETEPVNNSKWVYDYRFILPNYLIVISCRMTVACITNPDEKAYKREIGSYADKLLTHHETIRNSIVGMQTPTMYDVFGAYFLNYPEPDPEGIHQHAPGWYEYTDLSRLFTSDGQYYLYNATEQNKPTWAKCAHICGAVEKYSGLNSKEIYVDAILMDPQQYIVGADTISVSTPLYLEIEVDSLDGISPSEIKNVKSITYNDFLGREGTVKLCLDNNYYYNKFLVKFAIRILKHKRELYTRIGLHSLWNIINRLRVLAEKPQLDKGINYSILSLLGAAIEINSLVKGMGGAPLPNTISMSDIASRLEMTNSISLRKMLEEC